MPKAQRHEMLKKSDCTLPRPERYPGSLHHNNVGGSLLSKADWIKFEGKKWLDEMKKSEKYDISYFSVKAHCLKGWLQKTFPSVSIKTSKEILYDLEQDLGNEDQSQSDNDSDGDDELMDEDDGGNESSDMFESDSEKMEDDTPMTKKGKISTIRWYVEKLDDKLLDREEEVPEFVRNSRTYKKKRDDFIGQYIDHQFEIFCSQEVASSHTQLPKWVQNHEYLKQKFTHRTRVELANYRVLKNLNDTCRELRNDPSKAAFDQRAILVASVICTRYGVPAIDETQDVIKAAKRMKQELLTGNESKLNIKPRKEHELYPKSVFDLGKESWEQLSTVVEPDQHRRPNKSIKDGEETVPSRLQIVTDDEAYEQFRDKYEDKVKLAMKEHCEIKRQKYRSKSDGKEKQKVLERLQRMEDRFPSKSWFLRIKPPQTKTNNEHSTGNCKDCHSVQANYETLHKTAKKYCKCGTENCDNWQCTCDLEAEETEEECTCDKVCYCDRCESCQVKYSILNKKCPIVVPNAFVPKYDVDQQV